MQGRIRTYVYRNRMWDMRFNYTQIFPIMRDFMNYLYILINKEHKQSSLK